jgi:DNA primase
MMCIASTILLSSVVGSFGLHLPASIKPRPAEWQNIKHLGTCLSKELASITTAPQFSKLFGEK